MWFDIVPGLSTLLAASPPEGGLLQGFRAPLLTGFVAMAVAWILTPWVRSLAFKYGAVDDPKRDDRRIHKEPLARWGGIAIYVGIVISLAVVLPFAYPGGKPFPLYLIGMVVVGGALVAFGAWDDLKQLSARTQLLALLGGGLLVQLLGEDNARIQIATLVVPLTDPKNYLSLGWAAFPLTAIYIFVVTKTMDTIDGVDGLASGIATISAATLTIIAAYGEQPRVAIVAASIAGASLGFLRHNYNPAKIIMGTGGAYILGFMLACLSIVGALKTAAAASLLVPILAFGVPIFDAFWVIVRRIRSGVPITTADKRHLHHTLLGRGLTQRQTVWVLYTFAAILCAALIIIVKANV
jgi:UDP-GlcNAc:undecaprenyl-phosphate GlcNAc-1-phosphate transferase